MSSGNHVPAIVHSPPKPAKQNSHHKLSCVLVVAVVAQTAAELAFRAAKAGRRSMNRELAFRAAKAGRRSMNRAKGVLWSFLQQVHHMPIFFFLFVLCLRQPN